jgi:hypothetical protein
MAGCTESKLLTFPIERLPDKVFPFWCKQVSQGKDGIFFLPTTVRQKPHSLDFIILNT